MLKTLILFGLSASALGAVPHRWDVDYSESPSSYIANAFRGETLDLMPRYLEMGDPMAFSTNTVVGLYYRPKGTNVWFRGHDTDGVVVAEAIDAGRVRVSFFPGDDTGAYQYEFRVSVEDSGRSYRGYGVIKFADAPGENPNAALVAESLVDWATLQHSNMEYAPFVGGGGVTAIQATNIADGAIGVATQGMLTAESDPVASALVIAEEAARSSADAAVAQAATNNTAAAVAAEAGLRAAGDAANSNQVSALDLQAVTDVGATTTRHLAASGGVSVSGITSLSHIVLDVQVAGDATSGHTIARFGDSADDSLASITGTGNMAIKGSLSLYDYSVLVGNDGLYYSSGGALMYDDTVNYDTKTALTWDTSGDVGIYGPLSMTDNRITDVANPINATDAATKSYADTALSTGLANVVWTAQDQATNLAYTVTVSNGHWLIISEPTP